LPLILALVIPTLKAGGDTLTEPGTSIGYNAIPEDRASAKTERIFEKLVDSHKINALLYPNISTSLDFPFLKQLI
jgi:hypothetical protein